MATKKNLGKSQRVARHPGGSTRKRVEDPAAKYYEKSRRDREAYKEAMRTMADESGWSVEALPERHHDVFRQDGNAQSRSSFDFSTTFRNKT